MTTIPLITASNDLADYSPDVSLVALDQRKAALEMAASVVAVEDDAALADCVSAAGMVSSLIKGVKAAYDALKRPILDATKQLDTIHHGYADALALEKKRLDGLATSYVTAREDAARRAREAELARIAALERTAESLDEVRALALQRQAVPDKARVDGALARETWDYELLDAAELWRARPDLVALVPSRAAILAAIYGGVNLPGLRVFRETKVRAQA